MRAAATFVCLLILAIELDAQGFNWQPTLRRPYQAPRVFVGLDAGTGLAIHSGNLPYLENDIADPCCTYSGGSAIPLRLGVVAEYWFAPRQAVAFRLGLSHQSAGFESATQSYPRSSGAPLETRYQLDAGLSHLQLSGELRQRAGSSMLMVMAGLNANIVISASVTNREVIAGPAGATFVDGSSEQVLPTSGLDDASSMVLEPYLAVGYDVPLAFGYYLEPRLQLGYTLTSLSAIHPWSVLDVGFGLRLMKGR